MTRGSGNKQFIHIVFYGSDDIFVNFITPGMLKKSYLAPYFANDFNILYVKSFVFVKLCVYAQHYHIQSRIGPSNKSILAFFLNIVRDTISKVVLKIEICEKC